MSKLCEGTLFLKTVINAGAALWSLWNLRQELFLSPGNFISSIACAVKSHALSCIIHAGSYTQKISFFIGMYKHAPGVPMFVHTHTQCMTIKLHEIVDCSTKTYNNFGRYVYGPFRLLRSRVQELFLSVYP